MIRKKSNAGNEYAISNQPNTVTSAQKNVNQEQTKLKLYMCDECDAGYNTPYDFMSHKGTHTGEYPFVCLHCLKGYKTKLNLSNHIKLHTGEGLHPCDVCKKICTSAFLLKQHKRWHSDNPHACEECGKTFKVIEMLRQHHRSVHSGTMLPCPRCKQMLASEHSLKRHLKMHDYIKNKSWLHCPRCPLKYATHTSLRKHMNKHLMQNGEKIDVFSCDICGYKFCDKRRFSSHMRERHTGISNHKLPCMYCKEAFDKQDELDSHIEEHRQQPIGTCYICGGKLLQRHLHIMWDINSKLYACRRCPLKFGTLPSLMNHMQTHDDDPKHYLLVCEICGFQTLCRSKLEKHIGQHQQSTQSKAVSNYKCELCFLSFTTQLELKEHVGVTHGNKDCMCEYCGKLFDNFHGFNRHRQGHLDRTLLPCLYCKRDFTDIHALRLHMRIHQTRNLCCEICGAAFFSKPSYEAHKVSHANNGAHVCVTCKEAFTSEYLYFNHIKFHKTPPTCDDCDEQFSNTAALKKHAEVYHSSQDLIICIRCNLGLLDKAKLQKHSDLHIQDEKRLRRKAAKLGKGDLCVVSVTSRKRVQTIGLNPAPSSSKNEPVVPVAMAYNACASLPFFESYCTCKECASEQTVIPDATFPVSIKLEDTKLSCLNDTTQIPTTVIQNHKPVDHIQNSIVPLLPGFLCNTHSSSSGRQNAPSVPQSTNLQQNSIRTQLPEVYTCKKCQQFFASEVLYFNHVEVHKTPPICMECDEQFDDIIALKAHAKAYHCKSDLTICIRCNLGLLDKSKLEKHAYKHVQEDMKFKHRRSNISKGSLHREETQPLSFILSSPASKCKENEIPTDFVPVFSNNDMPHNKFTQCRPLSSSSAVNDASLRSSYDSNVLLQLSSEVMLLSEQDESMMPSPVLSDVCPLVSPTVDNQLSALHMPLPENKFSKILVNSTDEMPTEVVFNGNVLVNGKNQRTPYLQSASPTPNQNEQNGNALPKLTENNYTNEELSVTRFISNEQLERNFNCLLFGSDKLNTLNSGNNLCAFLKEALKCMRVPLSAKSTEEVVLEFLQSIMILYGGFSRVDFEGLGLNSTNLADYVGDLLHCNRGVGFIMASLKHA